MASTPANEICRPLQITKLDFYRRERSNGSRRTSETRKLQQRGHENEKPRQTEADLSLDKQIFL
jgi:hypothetical protein